MNQQGRRREESLQRSGSSYGKLRLAIWVLGSDRRAATKSGEAVSMPCHKETFKDKQGKVFSPLFLGPQKENGCKYSTLTLTIRRYLSLYLYVKAVSMGHDPRMMTQKWWSESLAADLGLASVSLDCPYQGYQRWGGAKEDVIAWEMACLLDTGPAFPGINKKSLRIVSNKKTKTQRNWINSKGFKDESQAMLYFYWSS